MPIFINSLRRIIKIYLIFIIVFFNGCIQQNGIKNINNDSHSRLKNLANFKIVINWKLSDRIPYKKCVFGPATLKLIRVSDNKIFKMSLGNYSLTDTTASKFIYQKVVNQLLPLKILNKTFSGMYLKDINFDDVPELIIESNTYNDETFEKSSNYNIFEIKNNSVKRINYFPTQALDYTGEIDKSRKEVSVTNYLNCCSYVTYVYKFNNNSKEKFSMYKEEEHIFDSNTNVEEITIKEKGKQDLKILKKTK